MVNLSTLMRTQKTFPSEYFSLLLRQLAEREVEVLLYTSPRHHDEFVDDEGSTLKQIADLARSSPPARALLINHQD